MWGKVAGVDCLIRWGCDMGRGVGQGVSRRRHSRDRNLIEIACVRVDVCHFAVAGDRSW